MSQIKIFSIVIVLLVVGVLALAVTRSPARVENGTKYDQFAQCLTDSGTVFYGAFWCPHCAVQKKMFGASQKLLPYVECSLPNAQGKTQECIDKGIEGYPTWEFPDGSRESGELSLEFLAEKTGCDLPPDDSPEASLSDEVTPVE